ncbi:MAG: HAD family hydrolase [Spirochaetales bacterium]|nr:HAD family hydrolase [Spirochaetales bacterium]
MLDPGQKQRLLREIVEKSAPLDPIPTTASPRRNGFSSEIRCIALDVYGTLVSSSAGDIGLTTVEGRRWAGFAAAAETLGVPADRIEELSTAFDAAIAREHERGTQRGIQRPEVDIREIWARVGRAIAPTCTEDPYIASLAALRFELTVNPVWPMPGAVETVRALRSAGVRMAIVSNAQFYTPLILEALFGRSVEDLGIAPAIWSYEYRAAKPSRELFERLVAEMGREEVDAHQILYVGNDMLNDVAGAATAGLKTALFAGDERSLRLRHDHPDVEGIRPDAVITELSELIGLIKEEPES